MKRRTFLRGAFYSLIATIGATLPFGQRQDIEPLSLVNQAQAQSGDFPVDNCRSKSKGLSRCKEHSGSCEGSHHACNRHGGRCQTQVQCKVKGHMKALPGR